MTTQDMRLLNHKSKKVNVKLLELLTLKKLMSCNFKDYNDFLNYVDQTGQSLFEISVGDDFQNEWNCNEVRDMQNIDLIASIMNKSEVEHEHDDVDAFVSDKDALQVAIKARYSELIGQFILVDFEDEVESTYVISVMLAGDKEFSVNCQFGWDHSYKTTSSLTCTNESGGDFYDSGLSEYLEDELGIEECSTLCNIIQEEIEDCADAQIDNSVEGYFADKGIYFKKDEPLDNFGTFYPRDVMMKIYKMDVDGFCLAYFEDTSEMNVDCMIKGYRVFDTEEEWIDLRNAVFSGEIDGSNYHVHYGDFTASKRAYEAIVADA